MRVFLIIALTSLVFAQDNKEDAINSIFGTNSSFADFLSNYEEVTPPPLKSFGALTKCGEGEQQNRFVCVPYYNCDPNTNTVQENADIDGTNKINIRMGEDEPKCDHYLEICCKLAGGANSSNLQSTPPPTTTAAPNVRTDKPRGNSTQLANCGVRNSQGLDFNLIGSTNEANFGEFPWMLAILRKNPTGGQKLALCGGSLIGPRVILTGAHCVHNVDVNDIKVRAGEWDTQTTNERIPFQERNVARKIVHEHFLKGNLYNDVALLILDRPFTKTASVGTVCLPNQDQRFNANDCFATGWGKDSFGDKGRYAVILKKIQMPLVQNENCQKALRGTRLGASFILHRSFTCAGGQPNLDTCTGDGGSPLVCPDPSNPSRYLQVGIVAWGIGCGESQIPGVYADVATFRTWIDLRLQELGINTNSYVQ
ncbi:phenoloxidase-activating factor 2 [Tribolium castaneum]|uniref:Phenoloxidase-activating factor 2 n=1 Tax=Tribolium castaneum TaxID=7070 RepID=D6WBS8_TRICA|nr:PREDICTED: tryptase alpha/beta-1 [Tribolium castaneum]EEZ99183.2 serine protease H4 [Tribolium castaneum]|eukprot:XP_008190341.1 PREDICTED: tryptase alpha/beta-1 [Tribolium castaneum]